jgi:sulfopyruvate decarboxylase TPP-binding subunit
LVTGADAGSGESQNMICSSAVSVGSKNAIFKASKGIGASFAVVARLFVLFGLIVILYLFVPLRFTVIP